MTAPRPVADDSLIPSPDDVAVDPRVARSRARIRGAAVALLGRTGYDPLTMEAVAEEAGVGKATIYRHWPSKAELVADAVSCLRSVPTPPISGDHGHDLAVILNGLSEMLSSGHWGRLLPTVLDAANRDAELEALMACFVDSRREPLRAVLRRAVADGALPTGTDIELAVDQLAGPLFYSRYVVRRAGGAHAIAAVVQTVWRGLGGLDTPWMHAAQDPAEHAPAGP